MVAGAALGAAAVEGIGIGWQPFPVNEMTM
jgi:hypothetical protein